MSQKHENPYRAESAYAGILDEIRKAGNSGITKADLCKNWSTHDVTVILSPRKEGTTRGDCRGSFSAKGHIYYVIPMKAKEGDTRFRNAWRPKEMEPRKRNSGEVKSEKTAKVTAKVTTPATPATATATA